MIRIVMTLANELNQTIRAEIPYEAQPDESDFVKAFRNIYIDRHALNSYTFEVDRVGAFGMRLVMFDLIESNY